MIRRPNSTSSPSPTTASSTTYGYLISFVTGLFLGGRGICRPSRHIIRLATTQPNKASTNRSQTSGASARPAPPATQQSPSQVLAAQARYRTRRPRRRGQALQEKLSVSAWIRAHSAAATQRIHQLNASARCRRPIVPRWKLFIGGNSRRNPLSSSAGARILPETLPQRGNGDVTNDLSPILSCSHAFVPSSAGLSRFSQQLR
jgi:hypothetical protein